MTLRSTHGDSIWNGGGDVERVGNGIWKLRFGVPETHTPVQLSEARMRHKELDGLSRNSPPINPNDVTFRRTSRGTVLELPLQASENIYGFGLQLKRMNHTGRKKVIRVNSDPVADTGDSHAPVPFYVSTAGYGVFVDTARYVTFYCGTNPQKGTTRDATLAAQKLGTSERELYEKHIDQGNRNMSIDVPSVDGVDVYLFEGPTMKDVVQRYNLFSGGGCLPPMWGLGMWYRIYTKADSGDAKRLANLFREERMPIDVFGLEPGWQSRSYSCSFAWSEERFPDHEEFITTLNAMNYRVNLWEHAFTHPSSEMYWDLLPYSGNFEVWGGLVPDLGMQESRDVFAGYHLDRFVKQGISGFKLDECDNSDYVQSNWSFPDIATFPSGMDGEQMHNLFGLLYQSTLQSAFESVGERTYSQVRSSGPLASSYPFVLYSDLYKHEDFIRGIVNSGFSGLLWTPEVRSADSVEDLIRRIQTTVFSPLALLNCWTFPNPPWMQVDEDKNRNGEFFDDYEEVQKVCRSLFELRMKLIPYLYSSFAEYFFTGTPPFRALVLDYPDDANTYEIDDAYMMGESMLVAPLVAGQTKRMVYLPLGTWRDFWTHEVFEGENWYEVEADLYHIPVFVKDNTLLPLANPVQYVADDAVFDITVQVFGDSPRGFFLYEDDGTTFEYREGKYNKVYISWDIDHGGSVKRVGDYPGARYRIVDWAIGT